MHRWPCHHQPQSLPIRRPAPAGRAPDGQKVGATLRTRSHRDTIADRILSEADVTRTLSITTGRNHALIRLAYAGGFRVAELVGLRWADLANANDETLFIIVLGKGSKTRSVARGTQCLPNVMDRTCRCPPRLDRKGRKSTFPSPHPCLGRARARRQSNRH